MIEPSPRLFAVLAAAGSSRRMGAALRPKQYLPLAGRTVLEHSLAALLTVPDMPVWVALAAEDAHWRDVPLMHHARVQRVVGGSERAHSVRRALLALQEQAGPDDWVLVHDAARPCVRPADIARLIDTLRADPVGGLLACPVRDTLKQIDADGRVARTVDRTGLWHALTPQMFRYGLLCGALDAALAAGVAVTDEASAVERLGYRPRLIEASADNLKITRPEDLALAESCLRSRAPQS